MSLESQVKGLLAKKLRDLTGWAVIRHEDHTRSGVPDMSATGEGMTSWWEVKAGTPTSPWETKDIQHLTAMKLARHGHCEYIIFEKEDDGVCLVSLAAPLFVGNTRAGDVRDQWRSQSTSWRGFDYDWVIKEIRKVHLR